MPTSPCAIPPVNVHLPSANAVITDIPVGSPTSPSSLTVGDEQLTRTVYYIHDGRSITFEIVNKRASVLEPDFSVEEIEPIPHNIFKRISKKIFCSCISKCDA